MAQQIPMHPSDITGEAQDDGTIEVAPDLAYLRLAIVNAVFYGAPGAPDWVLIDTGVFGMAGRIRHAAAERFGAGQVTVEAHGNVLAATAFLQGLACIEVSAAKLDVRDEAYPVIVAARAARATS